jgi:hypothetical protein
MARIKEAILGTSIAILFVIFVGVGINLIYKEPQYNNFCDESRSSRLISTRAACEADNGRWNPTAMEKVPSPAADDYEYLCTKTGAANSNGQSTFSCISYKNPDQGYCDVSYYCSQKYSNATSLYNRNVFIISGIIGIIVIIIGAVLQLTSVSAGLLGGGVLTIIYGTVRYWSMLADWGRFIIIGIALALLIYIGYRKFSPGKKRR